MSVETTPSVGTSKGGDDFDTKLDMDLDLALVSEPDKWVLMNEVLEDSRKSKMMGWSSIWSISLVATMISPNDSIFQMATTCIEEGEEDGYISCKSLGCGVDIKLVVVLGANNVTAKESLYVEVLTPNKVRIDDLDFDFDILDFSKLVKNCTLEGVSFEDQW
ncbi:hypothetical protein LXL04_010105 [Taraxacum kok-saghyz]